MVSKPPSEFIKTIIKVDKGVQANFSSAAIRQPYR